MIKRILIIISIAVVPFLFFIRSYTWYELKDKDQKINNEIPTVRCFFGRYEDELFVDIVECDWYGDDICVNGQKVVDETLQVIPYFSETGDTLKFMKKVEGSLKFRCPNNNNDCWTDELKISLRYKFDSLETTYNRQLLLTLNKKKDYGFSVH
jgi:hypothetical protein